MQKKLSMCQSFNHNDDMELCEFVGKYLEDDNIIAASPGWVYYKQIKHIKKQEQQNEFKSKYRLKLAMLVETWSLKLASIIKTMP